MPLAVVLPAPRTRAAEAVGAGRKHAWKPLPPQPVLGLIDNTKTRTDDLLNALGRELKRRNVISEYFVHRKPDAAHSITPEVRAELLARAHVIVSGIGD
jgi:hypothetical protein